MKVLRSVAAVAVVLAACYASPVYAQASRTWVSGVGDDANPCSRTAPCKTFAGAISKMAPGGEIDALDPAGYGAVTITKAMTISGVGTNASVLVSGTNGIIIQAGASDVVVLRNLSIQGLGTGLNGIRYISGKQLSVENLFIQGFTTRGIDISVGAASEVLINHTTITNCNAGVFASTSAGQLIVNMTHLTVENMTNHGVEATTTGGTTFVTIDKSSITNNNQDGIRTSSASSTINLSESDLSFNNGTAANVAVGAGRIRLALNTIDNNNVAINAGGGTVESTGNNRVAGFGSNPGPVSTYLQQ